MATRLLKQWRTREGLTQSSAAEKFGVSQPSYSDYENGRKTPRTKLALHIARVTDGAVPVASWGDVLPDEDASDDEEDVAAPDSSPRQSVPGKGAA